MERARASGREEGPPSGPGKFFRRTGWPGRRRALRAERDKQDGPAISHAKGDPGHHPAYRARGPSAHANAPALRLKRISILPTRLVEGTAKLCFTARNCEVGWSKSGRQDARRKTCLTSLAAIGLRSNREGTAQSQATRPAGTSVDRMGRMRLHLAQHLADQQHKRGGSWR